MGAQLEGVPPGRASRFERNEVLVTEFADDLPDGHARVRRRTADEELPSGPSGEVGQVADRHRPLGRHRTARALVVEGRHDRQDVHGHVD